ncbi:chaplin [Streptomyces catenulae]|uniref:Chaplin n=1 Tax=Streptomyces catenulae TaxID=66875 RepID=A0ABV2Z0A6_9ACTN|nr:chaplin family protein [Streptomyces catenulae]
MRQVARKGLITVAAAGGILAATVGYAHADAGAQGGAANSPGVASGNNVQVPVHVPVNTCGNTVNVVGLLNPAMGNGCANGSGEHRTSPGDGHHEEGGKPAGQGGAQSGHGGSTAEGGATGSPGVASGNNVQVPVDVPVNACGNSVDVVGLLNPTFGNECGNDAVPTRPVEPGHPAKPGNPEQPHHPTVPVKEHPSTPGPRPQTASHVKIADTPEPTRELAHTGSESIGYAASASAGLILGGALLYRRARAARR